MVVVFEFVMYHNSGWLFLELIQKILHLNFLQREKLPGSEKKKKKKSKKDPNAPKRPQSAYFLWFNANREELKKDNPDISITDLSKKAGELWKQLEDKTVRVVNRSARQITRNGPIVVLQLNLHLK